MLSIDPRRHVSNGSPPVLDTAALIREADHSLSQMRKIAQEIIACGGIDEWMLKCVLSSPALRQRAYAALLQTRGGPGAVDHAGIGGDA